MGRIIRFGNIKWLEEFVGMGDLEVVGGIVGDLDFNIGWLGEWNWWNKSTLVDV